MLKGEKVTLRLVRQSDLAMLHELLSNLETRGAYFPLGVMSEPALRSEFEKNGFWDQDEGMLLIVDQDGEIVGASTSRSLTTYRATSCPISCSEWSTRAGGTARRQ